MITVVIPVKNREQMVLNTLRSLEAQTMQPDAIILVDNGSTDRTEQVIRAWSRGRTNVEVISEAKPGAAAARNAGLRHVGSPYVMFFDSDDLMPATHIEEVTAAIQRTGYPDIINFTSEFKFPDGRIKSSPHRSGDPMKNHIFHATLATQRYCVKTDFLRRAGAWNEDLLGWDDLELGVRLIAGAPRIEQVNLSQPVHIIAHADSITGIDFSSKAGQWERALNAIEQTLANDPYHRRMINYRRAILGGHYLREGRPDLAAGLKLSPAMKLIATYVKFGGRGVAIFANIEKFR